MRYHTNYLQEPVNLKVRDANVLHSGS